MPGTALGPECTKATPLAKEADDTLMTESPVFVPGPLLCTHWSLSLFSFLCPVRQLARFFKSQSLSSLTVFALLISFLAMCSPPPWPPAISASVSFASLLIDRLP